MSHSAGTPITDTGKGNVRGTETSREETTVSKKSCRAIWVDVGERKREKEERKNGNRYLGPATRITSVSRVLGTKEHRERHIHGDTRRMTHNDDNERTRRDGKLGLSYPTARGSPEGRASARGTVLPSSFSCSVFARFAPRFPSAPHLTI